MQSLQERVDLLRQDFHAGEKDEVKFNQAYTDTLKLVQLVYTEESSQFIGIHEAISAYTTGGKTTEARLALKDNCLNLFNVLTFSKED